MTIAPASIPALIDQWPTIGEFALAVGCGYEAARQMRRRGKIAPEHWGNVVAACMQRNIEGVTLEWLAQKRLGPSSTPTKEAAE